MRFGRVGKFGHWLQLAVVVLAVHGPFVARPEAFRFRPYLDSANTLQVSVQQIQGNAVTIGGMDSARPAVPFTFQWGDGTVTESWLPAKHEYADRTTNYVVHVTAHYSSSNTSSVDVFVRFSAIDWTYDPDPNMPKRFQIPGKPLRVTSTMPGYNPPDGTLVFGAEAIDPAKREAICYVMSVAQTIQLGYVRRNVTEPALGRHIMLRNPSGSPCYALWFTQPPAMVCAPSYLGNDIGFSSLFHEMGHCITLNAPAAFRMGGRIDGDMNAIFSEALAGLFQHATVYEILNEKNHHGLSLDMVEMIRSSGIDSVRIVAQAYNNLRNGSSAVTSFNDPSTPEDETFDTFLSVVYVFMELAETKGDYKKPLTRAMDLFATFNSDDAKAYQDPANDSFRLTYWVAALSHGFETDLRGRFANLQFPINEDVYERLMSRVK